MNICSYTTSIPDIKKHYPLLLKLHDFNKLIRKLIFVKFHISISVASKDDFVNKVYYLSFGHALFLIILMKQSEERDMKFWTLKVPRILRHGGEIHISELGLWIASKMK